MGKQGKYVEYGQGDKTYGKYQEGSGAIANESTAPGESLTDALDALAGGSGAIPSDAPPEVIGTTNPGGSLLYSRGDHVHEHGTQGRGTQHTVATAAEDGFQSAADKAKEDTLASAAAAIAGQILFADGAGGSYFGPNSLNIDNCVTVGAGADVNFNTIHEAVDYAVAQGASAINWWLVQVYPGFYIEEKTTIPPGVVVAAISSVRSSLCYVVADDALDDLFVMTGGFLVNMNLAGVTDANHALVRCSTPATASTISQCRFSACSNAIWADNGATALLNNNQAIIDGPAQSIDCIIYASGIGTLVAISTFTASVPAAVLPLYPGVDPIRRAIEAEDLCLITGSAIFIDVDHNTANQAGLEAGWGARVEFGSVSFHGSHVGVLINAGGNNTLVSVNPASFDDCDTNLVIQSSTGVFFVGGLKDEHKATLVPGAKEVGIFQEVSTEISECVGPLQLEYIEGRGIDLPTFVRARHSSAATAAGSYVTDAGGLNVDVANGTGWIHRGSPYFDATEVAWEDDTLLLTGSATNYVFINPDTLLLTHGVSVPADNAILLAIVVCAVADVRFIHSVEIDGSDRDFALETYLRTTRRVVLKDGLAISEGSTAVKLDLDDGCYYYGLLEEEIIGGSDISWSYFYGTGGATEIAGVLSLDTTQYDNAGALAAMTPTWYRNDTVYVTSDGRVSIILGNVQKETQGEILLIDAQDPPSFLEPTYFLLARVTVREGVGIDTITDLRPVANWGAAGGGGVAGDHSLLTHLLVDSHPQYLPLSGTRPMGAALDMGTNAIVACTTINGVDPEDHHTRHEPGGLDALATAAPTDVQIGDIADEGNDPSFARSDHVHGVSSGAPVDVGDANDAGTASTFSSSDHVHAHGAHTEPTDHAAATMADNGFMDSASVAKLAGIEDGATASPLSDVDPVNVTKATADHGTATEAARQDHKHDIATATAVSLAPGSVNAEGSGSNLARATHTHALPAFGVAAGEFCQGDDTRLSNDRTASGLRSATTVVEVDASAAPSTGQVLTATSEVAAAWADPTSIFGSNYSITRNDTRTTTNHTIWDVNKVSIATGALTGTFEISWGAGIENAATNRFTSCRLYNATDVSVVGTTFQITPAAATNVASVGGTATVVLSGVSKTFSIQFTTSNAASLAACSGAWIKFQRVA
jgi:hypothetical protein